MRKRISLKTRRPDLSVREFRDHYENRHVPLGLGFIDRFQWRRYVRNHVASVGGSPIGFDCYSEFWVDDGFDDASLESFIQSADFAVLNEDDRRFLDVTERASFDVEEWVVKPSREKDSASGKTAVLWSRGEEARDARSVARAIVDSLGDSLLAASLDMSIGPVPRALPFDTLLTLTFARSGQVVLESPGEPACRYSVLEIEAAETLPHLLFTE